MKQLIRTTFILTGLIFMSISCDLLEVDKVLDPNSPSTTGVLDNASPGELQDLVSGLESVHRNYNNANSDWWALTGTLSRELFYINTSDPTFAIDWLQLPARSLDAEENPAFFVDASGYEAPYGAIRQANLLIESIENTNTVTEAQKNGYLGFANTIKAYQFQFPLMHQYQKGIRVDVSFSEPLNPGGFLGYDQALAEIRTILGEGATQLGNAGNSFTFVLSDGFDGFDTPAAMLEVNRAIAARFALYADDWQGALDALDDSFMDLNAASEADLMVGPAHVFGGGNDIFNPYYYIPNASEEELVVPNPIHINEADAGDLRIDRMFELRDSAAVTAPGISGLSSAYQIGKYASSTADIPFIRNEELILIYAEANVQLGGATNLANAVTAINTIRGIWGVGPYTGTVDQASLIDEVLKQRRYSLWGEGHRWVDMRRYDRLDQIDTSIGGGRVPTEIGRPQAEIDWDDFSSENS
ncbi:RagB/SusD family nutrient uptake outer membrane protein [Gracilimonas sp.]|uniref:RagB/SusD family nutrient uptake outer membrane protein n=1 Tax=Gracilimonas sp. TaxID=1974203 RepID=UPI0032EED2DF